MLLASLGSHGAGGGGGVGAKQLNELRQNKTQGGIGTLQRRRKKKVREHLTRKALNWKSDHTNLSWASRSGKSTGRVTLEFRGVQGLRLGDGFRYSHSDNPGEARGLGVGFREKTRPIGMRMQRGNMNSANLQSRNRSSKAERSFQTFKTDLINNMLDRRTRAFLKLGLADLRPEA